MPSHAGLLPLGKVRFVKELYPRLKADDDAIERYREALDLLPIEIMREAIPRNASHGQQLSNKDKQHLAQSYYGKLDQLQNAERVAEIATLLAVNERSVQRWTKDVRKAEKQAMQDKAWEMHLHCFTQQQIADALNTTKQTVNDWLSEKRQLSEIGQAPSATADKPWGSVQHFDVWNFQSNAKDAGAQSYFGACPPQIIENLLWLYTTPGESVVVDPFAGTGTTLEVAHRMGRRAWVSDIRGNYNNPQLIIHKHDITQGWHADAPKADLIFLDPPYWKQASGRYSQEPGELAEMSLDQFNAAWLELIKTCKANLKKGGKVALIISPTEDKEAGIVIDHAFEMAAAAMDVGMRVARRVIVTYQTQQATDVFDRFILNRDNWESRRFGVEDRFASSDLEWIRNQVISPSVIDDCCEEFIGAIGQQYFDQFYERMSGNIPIPIRWEADRILTYNGVVVAAVDVKAKGPNYSNWAIEIMALLANSKAHARYGCPMYYAFPPIQRTIFMATISIGRWLQHLK